MDLPYFHIASSLKKYFCACHFKDTAHSPDSKPHYYISVPIEDESSLLFCIITSKVKRRIDYHSRHLHPEAQSSLVMVDKNILSFLTEVSVIECNYPKRIRIKDLKKRIDPKYDFRVISRKIPQSLQEEIKTSIINSPIVKPFIKQLLK